MESKRARALLSEGEAASAVTAKRSPGSAALASAPCVVAPIFVFGEGSSRPPSASARASSDGRRPRDGIGTGAALAERVDWALATGERARKRTVETREDLTAREAQIARLAGEGFSSPEIGARLFISPKTVEYHLRKVFSKLGITSRTQLDRVAATDRRGAAGLNQAGLRRDR